MNNKLIIITGILATAGLVAYIMRKKANNSNVAVAGPSAKKPGHHLTGVFAKAKNYYEEY